MNVAVVGEWPNGLPADDDHPYRTGAWRPQEREYDAHALPVVGEIPPDLAGVYLRNTENPRWPPIRRYHPFDGDGMVHAVTFRDGQASYRNRFVRTKAFLAEAEAGGSLWAGLAERPELSVAPLGWGARGRMKDASSTDVVVHAGTALTTFYQCGDVYQLCPLTLEQQGRADWNGAFPADLGVSAHARVDENCRELIFFNYSTTEPYLHVGMLDRSGSVVRYVPVDLPGARLPHDLAFTERYVVLNDLPLFWDPALIERGLYAARFHPEIPSRLGLLPRDGSGPVRWFEFEPTYVLHWVNAYEDGDEVIIDGFFQGCPEPAGAPPGGPADPMFRFLAADLLETRLHRWRINVRTGATREDDLSDRCTEFGAIDGRRRGRPYRHAYATTNKPGWFLMDGIVHHDTGNGTSEGWSFADGVYCSEPAVARRPGADSESDAYLITITVDLTRDCSEAVVFDAGGISDGPVASVRLPERVSSGTHAFWAPAEDLPGW